MIDTLKIPYPRNKDKKKTEQRLQWWREKIGTYALSNVTPAVIVEYRDKLSTQKTKKGKPFGPATVNRYLAAMSHVFKVAVQVWHWLPTNPMRQVTRKEELKGRIRFLNNDERIALLEACKKSENPHLYPIVVLALSTGARKGEILDLEWKQVGLNNNRIILEDTKNNERRVLPLTGFALTTIKNIAKVRRLDTPLLFYGAKKHSHMHTKSVVPGP